MDLLKPKSRSMVVLRISSIGSWELGTHFLGKTLLCASTKKHKCPLCEIQRPKQKLYCVAQMKGAEGYGESLLCEVGHEVLQQLRAVGFDPTSSLGFCWRQERRSDRPGWRVVDYGQQDVEHVSASFLPFALETLFGLQLTIADAVDESLRCDRDEWLRLHDRAILNRALFACQSGSHHVA